MLIEQVKSLLAEGKRPQAIDCVYDTMDAWLVAGDFQSAREALRQAAEENLPGSILISLIIVTVPWKGELGEAREHLAAIIYGDAV
jgi:hypothetical protein